MTAPKRWNPPRPNRPSSAARNPKTPANGWSATRRASRSAPARAAENASTGPTRRSSKRTAAFARSRGRRSTAAGRRKNSSTSRRAGPPTGWRSTQATSTTTRTKTGNNNGYLTRTNLEGEEEKLIFIGEAGLRGLALDSSHVYWATQAEGDSIGRCNLELEECTNEYIDVEGAANGLAAGASHLFWAVNGDAAKNPGNDLYRYEPQSGNLEDLTVLPGNESEKNGAEVQGMLGASADGSHIYFAANGVLAAGASYGDCKGAVHAPSGKCNLYAWHEGQTSFIAPLNEDGGSSDAYNWVGTPYHVPDPSSYLQRTSFLGEGGKVLVFRSQEQLSGYENTPVNGSCGEVEGHPRPCPEFYRYDAEEPGQISCLTCRPSGEDTEGGPKVGSIKFAGFSLVGATQAYPSRNLSADGERFFFETAEALSPADTNGKDGCRALNDGLPACLDVYEWVAPGNPPVQRRVPRLLAAR